MLVFFTIFVLILLSILAAALRPVYASVSLKELRRRSHKGDRTAVILCQVSRHGKTADAFLLAVSVAASAAAITLIAVNLPFAAAAILASTLIVIIFIVLPKNRSKTARWLALKTSPLFAKFLINVRPLTSRLATFIRNKRPVTIHTDLYEKADLLDLLELQKIVPHNRIEKAELAMAAHILAFGDKKVGDYMALEQSVHFVQSEDPVGPILLTELYDSGFSQFPVRNHEEVIVGTLFLKDLVDKRVSGIVGNVMSPAVFYVNDSAPLEQVLAAFIKSKHHLFIVVNNLEEVVGVISIEDVLEQMIGRKITDEFDRYDDLRAVASKAAGVAEKNHTKP